MAVIARRIGRCGLLGLDRLGLFSQHQLGCCSRVEALVQLEADVGVSGADEDLDGNLTHLLGSEVEVNDAMHALKDLALDNGITGEPRIEVHSLSSKPPLMEDTLNPVNKFSRDLLDEEDLHIRDVVSIAAGQIDTGIRRRATMRTRAPGSVGLGSRAAETSRRTRSAAIRSSEITLRAEPIPSAPTGGRGPTRPVVIASPARFSTKTLRRTATTLDAARATSLRRPVAIIPLLFLLGARNLQV